MHCCNCLHIMSIRCSFSRPLLVNTVPTVYPKKYAHGFVVLCFVLVMQSFIMNSHEVFIHIHQACFAGTGAIVRLPQCQWSKPDGYGKISQCITTTKHSKAKTVCIFLGMYCRFADRGVYHWKYHADYGQTQYIGLQCQVADEINVKENMKKSMSLIFLWSQVWFEGMLLYIMFSCTFIIPCHVVTLPE